MREKSPNVDPRNRQFRVDSGNDSSVDDYLIKIRSTTPMLI